MRAIWTTAMITALIAITAVFPKVEELPFGMDEVLTILFGSLTALAGMFEPFAIVYNRVLLALGIAIMFYFWRWVILLFHFIKS